MRVLTKEEKREARKYKNISRLFKHFGLEPFAWHPGVRSFVPGHGNLFVDLDDNALKFIVPLLKELVKYRIYGTQFGMDFKSKRDWWKRKEVI